MSKTINPRTQRPEPANIERLLGPAGIILDCTNNAETRYLINDYALAYNKALISAAANGLIELETHHRQQRRIQLTVDPNCVHRG